MSSQPARNARDADRSGSTQDQVASSELQGDEGDDEHGNWPVLAAIDLGLGATRLIATRR